MEKINILKHNDRYLLTYISLYCKIKLLFDKGDNYYERHY